MSRSSFAPLRVPSWMKGCIVLGLLGFSLVHPSQGQAPNGVPADRDDPAAATVPLELQIARLRHQRQLLAASLTPLKTYLSRLDEFAQQSAGERNYSAAAIARKERQTMRLELERIDKEMLLLETREKSIQANLLPERILLPIEKASLTGVEWDAEKKCLTRWQRPGASAEWKLPGLPPGGYEILLTYHCTPLEGGTLNLEESVFTLTGEMDTTLRGPETKLIGTLKVTDGSGPLRLVARTVIKNNLMDLHSLELVPANR